MLIESATYNAASPEVIPIPVPLPDDLPTFQQGEDPETTREIEKEKEKERDPGGGK
jgi:hypothetical protein